MKYRYQDYYFTPYLRAFLLFTGFFLSFILFLQNPSNALALPVNTSDPVGFLDTLTKTSLSGWAYDPDAGTDPIDVHIYIDGVLAVSLSPLVADQYRPDIVGYQGIVGDANHGFSYSGLSFSPGSHTVSAYAINTPTGQNTLLGTKTVNVTDGNSKPIGYIDSVTSNGKILGWAADPDDYLSPVWVHAYFDSPAGSGANPVGFYANLPRNDVNLAGYPGDHGYEITIPDQYLDGKAHTVYVYAIDLNDSTGVSNSLLTNSPKSFGGPGTVLSPTGDFDYRITGQGDITVTTSQGGSVKTEINAYLLKGDARTVGFTAGGVPTGTIVSFSSDSCALNCSTAVALAPSFATLPGTYAITIKADASGVQKATSFTFKVLKSSTIKAALEFSASQNSVYPGDSAVITWVGRNVKNCTASGDWSGTKSLSGSESFSNLTTPKTYTLTCANSASGEPVTGAVTISIINTNHTLTIVKRPSDWGWVQTVFDDLTLDGNIVCGTSCDTASHTYDSSVAQVRFTIKDTSGFNYTYSVTGFDAGDTNGSYLVNLNADKTVRVVFNVPEIRGRICKDDNGNGSCDSGEIYIRDSSIAECSNASFAQALRVYYWDDVGSPYPAWPSDGSRANNKCDLDTGFPVYSAVGFSAGVIPGRTYTVELGSSSGLGLSSGWVYTGTGTNTNPRTVVVEKGPQIVDFFIRRP